MGKYLYNLLFVLIIQCISNAANAQIDMPKWVDDIGGSGSNCISSAIQVDKQNNIYVTGFFSGTADFDPSVAVYNLTAKGAYDTFVAKYTAAGKFIWAVSMGGEAGDYVQVNSMAIDQNGDPIISGQYNSSDLDADPGPGTFNLSTKGDFDAFVIKLNTNGGFLWAKSIGGGSTDYGSHISTDSQGNIIECMRYESNGVIIGGTNYKNSSNGNFNGLIIKYDPNGNVLWVINLNDIGDLEANGSEVDSQDNIIVTGPFQNNDNFNPLGIPVYLNSDGQGVYVAKYKPSGNLMWVGFSYGSILNDFVCINSSNDIYIACSFASTQKFNGVTLNPTGRQDIFLAKYSSDGIFQYFKDIGGVNGTLLNYTVRCSQDDNIFIGGFFSGKNINFDPSSGSTALISDHGQQDFFLAKYDNDLNYKWAFSGGSPNCSQSLGRSVAIDNNNDVIFTGGFCSTVNFSASTCNPYSLTAQSDARDCFLGKYVQNKGSSAEQITAFSVPQEIAPAVIDQTNLKITVTVPFGTNITALVPTVKYTASGLTLSPASGTPEDFTSGVTYTLSGSCVSPLNYTVNVVIASNTTAIQDTTCSGNTITLTGDTESPVPGSYLWQIDQNNVWVNADGTNTEQDYQTDALVNTGNTNVVYSFRRQINTNGVISYDSYHDVTTLPVISGNTITAPAVKKFCTSGDPSIITGSVPSGGYGTYTYQWQNSNDGTTFTDISGATSQNYDPPIINNTTYYRRVLTSTPCATTSNSNVIVIKVLSLPTAPANITQSVCMGSTTTLTIASPQEGVSYNWYDSDTKTNLLFTGTSYTTGALNANTTYYIEADNGTCTSTSLATAQVNVDASPLAPALMNSTLQACSGTPVTLSIASPQAGYTYNWYSTATGSTPVATGVSFITGNITSDASYYAEAVNSSGCISTDRTEADITVVPIPVAPTVADVSVCAGSSAVINVNSPQTGITYNWYDTATGVIPLFSGSQYTTPSLNNTSTYYVEAVSNSGGCTSPTRTAVQVTVTPLPITPANIIQSVCKGNQTTLTIANPQPGIIYNWYDSTAKTTLLFTGTAYTTGPINADTYYYIEADNGTCAGTSLATAEVNINPVPATPSLVNNILQTCSGTPVTLAINNPQANFIYNWYSTATGGTPLANGTTFTTGNLTADVSYFAEAVNNSNCTSPTRTEADITVIPIPVAPTVSGASTCAGSPVTLNVSSPQAGITYNWYATATGGPPIFSGSQYTTPLLNNNITYYVEAASSVGGCTSTTRTAVQVTVTPLPTVPANINQSVCAGSTATLTITDPQTGISYNWYDSATKTNLLFTGTSYTTGPVNGNTTYYIEAENGTCSSTSLTTAQVNVNALPSPPAVLNNAPQTCSGAQLTIAINNPQAGYNYNWYTAATGGTPVSTGVDFVTPPLTSNTTFYAEAVNSSGCPSNSRTPVNITISPLPDISTQGASVCPGTSTTLNANTTDANATINWYLTATGGSIIATGAAFKTPVLNSNTTFYAESVNNTSGCVSSSRAAATVSILQQLAAPVVTVGPTTLSSITFEWGAVPGASGYQVSTDNGATFTTPSSGSAGLSHTITGLQQNESVTIIVQATGNAPCQLSGSSTAVTAIAHDPTNDIIYVANAFTPNGDGKNDVVYVHSNNIKSMDFYIYDQWGEMLFKSASQAVGWDGTYKGVKQPVGVYVYFVKAVMNDGTRVNKKGTITLLR